MRLVLESVVRAINREVVKSIQVYLSFDILTCIPVPIHQIKVVDRCMGNIVVAIRCIEDVFVGTMSRQQSVVRGCIFCLRCIFTCAHNRRPSVEIMALGNPCITVNLCSVCVTYRMAAETHWLPCLIHVCCTEVLNINIQYTCPRLNTGTGIAILYHLLQYIAIHVLQ